MKAVDTMKGTSDKQKLHRCQKDFWKSGSAPTWNDVEDAVMVIGFAVSVVATGGAAAFVEGAVEVAADGAADAVLDEGADATGTDAITDTVLKESSKIFKLVHKIGHALKRACDYGRKLVAAYKCYECIESKCEKALDVVQNATTTGKALEAFDTSTGNVFTLSSELYSAVKDVKKLYKAGKGCIKCWKKCKKLMK